MTNPSSEHSTEGTAGIINIRLKEDHRHGYFGSAETDIGTRGNANVMLGYRHLFGHDHHIDMNVSYNIWQGPNDNRFREDETWVDGSEETIWQSQHQDVKISNWEAAFDYFHKFLPWLRLETGYKGNYNHENSPASYAAGSSAENLRPLDNLYNRFKYDTDISALYLNFSRHYEQLSLSVPL